MIEIDLRVVWVVVLFHKRSSVDSDEDGITAVHRLRQGIRFREMELAYGFKSLVFLTHAAIGALHSSLR